MQRAEAGMPNAAARVIRVAVGKVREGNFREKSNSGLTYIAPHWCPVDGVAGPHNGVHKLIKAG